MDVFIEQLIKRKFGLRDYLIFAGILAAGICLVLLSVLFLLPFATFVLAGAPYGVYFLTTSRSEEFEASVTNGNLTIDKIIHTSRRKQVISIDAHTVEKMGKYDPQKRPVKSSKFNGRRIVASETENGEGAWYFCARDPKAGNVFVIFSPDERTLDAIRPFLPRQVARDAFGRY